MNPISVLKNHWRALGVIFLCLASYLAGVHRNIPSEAKVTEKTSETSSKKTKKDVTTVVVKKPDGTTTTTTTDHSETTKTETIEKKATTRIFQMPKEKNYSLGLRVEIPATLDPLKALPTYEAELGKRVIGDFWLEASYNYNNHTVGLGVRYEF